MKRIISALRALKRLHDEQVKEFQIEFAGSSKSTCPEKRLDALQLRKALVEHDIFQPDAPEYAAPVAQLSLEDIRAIAAIRFPDIDFTDPSVSTEEIGVHINAIQSKSLTPEEEALGHFTRRKLKTLSTWPKWQAGERQQLDHFHSLGMYGSPVKRPADAIVLRPHWQYRVKGDGTRRSRNCCDGSPRSAPVLHGIASTYSSCVDQPVQRLFVALSAHLGFPIYGGDAKDAYAHSPPPENPTYVSIDDAYAEWYEHRFNKKVDRSHVLPVLHALQGHPESGRLWEQHINSILTSPELGFRHTTHDRTIYSAVFDGVTVLLLRQVDDFALACPDEALAKRIYGIIGSKLQLPSEERPPFSYLGLLEAYNGVDVQQTRDTVSLSCHTYIARVLRTHGWSSPDHKNHESSKASPLPVDCSEQMYKEVGPAEGTRQHSALAEEQGFSFRTVLGELLYAYVTCRPDIGYAVTTLSKFSSAPAKIHYSLLKNIAKYLRRTIDWGIVYHKTVPNDNLPASPHIPFDTGFFFFSSPMISLPHSFKKCCQFVRVHSAQWRSSAYSRSLISRYLFVRTYTRLCVPYSITESLAPCDLSRFFVRTCVATLSPIVPSTRLLRNRSTEAEFLAAVRCVLIPCDVVSAQS